MATWKLESPGDSFFILEVLLSEKILLLTRNPFIKVTLVMVVGDVGKKEEQRKIYEKKRLSLPVVFYFVCY